MQTAVGAKDGHVDKRRKTILAVATFVAVVALLAVYSYSTLSIPGVRDNNRAAMMDFREQAYYPVRSLLAGINPYDPRTHMPANGALNVFAPYSPVALLLFLPFGLLPLTLAQAIFFCINICLILVLSAMALRLAGQASPSRTFYLASVLLLSRPGEWNTVLGQFGALAAIATIAGIYLARSSSLWGGLGLAVASFKPTFGIPAAIVMLAQRDYKAVVVGLAAAGSACVVLLVPLAAATGGLNELAASLLRAVDAWHQESGFAGEPRRVDFVRMLAPVVSGPGIEITSALLVLTVGFFAIRYACGVAPSAEANARHRTAGFGCIVVLASMYHATYDLLVLVPALVWLWYRMDRRRALFRYLPVFVVLALPFVNYLNLGRIPLALGLSSGQRFLFSSLNAWMLHAGLLLWSVELLAPSGRVRVQAPRSLRAGPVR